MIFISCHKEKLPEIIEDPNTPLSSPVFYVKCKVNGLPVELAAGVDNYYMHSSYYFDTNNVYVYKASLAQKSCSNNCGYSITILINDDKVSSFNSSPNINQALKVGDYVFGNPEQVSIRYNAVFIPQQAEVLGNEYNWKFGDTMSIDGYEARDILLSEGKNRVNFSSKGDCFAEHFNVFDVGNPFQVNISATRISFGIKDRTLKYKFTGNIVGQQQPYSYHWDFGDNNVSAEASPEHTYREEGYYTAMLRLIDTKNDTCVSYYQVAAFAKNNRCNANFTAQFTPVPILTPKVVFSAVTILVTDQNGNTYSSGDLQQSNNSNFKITSIEEYKTNENGEPTKKLKLKFNCTATANGNQIEISDGEAVIAVSYK